MSDGPRRAQQAAQVVADARTLTPPLTTSAVERASRVVEEVLEKASRDGEKTASLARLTLCGLVVLTWPLTTWRDLVAMDTATVGVETVALVGLVWSSSLLWRLRTGKMTRTMRTLSIIGDAALVISFLFGFVFAPTDAAYPGVDRLSGFGAVYLAIFAAGLRLSRTGAVLSAAIHAAGVTTLFVLDHQWNHKGDSVANIVTCYVLLVTAGICAWLVAVRTRRLVLEGAQKTLLAERARARLGAYVSEEVAEASLQADEMRMGGSRQELAVLFSDLRSFTTASESADPEQVVRELNEYFEVMVRAIKNHGGVVDKYIGDSIMAVFGAPTARPDDALRAIQAAGAMERALTALNEKRTARGHEPLKHGIGVHYGVAVAGNIGTTERAQYTVIGDTVNVAARLESSTKEQGTTVLVSSTALEAARRAGGAETVPALVPKGSIHVKGRAEPLDVLTFG